MYRIDSIANEKIKLTVKISDSSKHRIENGLFFLEGLRLCRDAAQSGIKIKYLFVSQGALEKLNDEIEFLSEKAEEAYIVSDKVVKKLALTKNSQEVFCVCETPKENSDADIIRDGKYIAMENIQDPSNLGAICRTAEAIGVTGAILFNCCDCYNPKAQRASMGSLLRLPLIFTENLFETLNQCKVDGMNVFVTVPNPDAKQITDIDFSGGNILVIGNEGNGVSEEIKNNFTCVTIKMKGRAESLNASMAAAIAMWEMLK